MIAISNSCTLGFAAPFERTSACAAMGTGRGIMVIVTLLIIVNTAIVPMGDVLLLLFASNVGTVLESSNG